MIRILDCTLRDGGYINNWNFSQSQIRKIVCSLEESDIDIIELGYLDNKKGAEENSTRFNSVFSVDSVLNSVPNNHTKVVMIDLFSFDVDKLPKQSNTKIDGIRLAFHKKDMTDALLAAETITTLGYQLYLQPMVTKNYNNNEFTTFIKQTNSLNLYALYIVDSFGSMTLKEFQRYIDLADDNLDKNVKLGYHSHNNMQLAFSNAIDLCTSNVDRDVIIDSSIYGMGRGAGNLNTELICDYLNNNNNKEYKVIPLLEIIDEILIFYFKQNYWGFTPVQYLSASLNCHPNYASYLVDKKTTHIADIKKVLEKIPLNKRSSFDEQIVDDLYRRFLLKSNSNAQGKIKIPADKQVLLIASGHSVIDNLEVIKQKVESGNYFVIGLNHKPQFDCDYYFFSNQQRFDDFKELLPIEQQVITSNIKSSKKIDTVIDLNRVVYVGDNFVTNVAILAINYLISQEIGYVEIAGLDGYHTDKDNYAYDATNIPDNEHLFVELNQVVESSLIALKLLINIKLTTPSIYENIL